MSEIGALPGDKIASIEEYETGHNTFDDGNMVRAATVGIHDLNKETRVANIKHPKMIS
ncbi:MAG: RNA-binding protein, partial [Nitrosarchaeum sp.]|nr:RNA-binding protein [Nitrosarchaeum sp.]